MGVATSPPDQSSTAVPGAGTAPSTGGGGGTLKYPIDMKDTQDRIKFVTWKVKKGGSLIAGGKTSDKDLFERVGETAFLPIQPSITDQNAVNWGAGELNEIQRQLVNASLDAMTSKKGFGEVTADMIKKLNDNILAQKGFGGLARIYLAEQAVGVQGLLSRATGQVLNPNLELLFQGPTLRPFNFTFKMSPRSKKEADSVKSIINYFKRNMAVRREDSALFLKAPYVFEIEYQHGSEQHKSINLIKICALQSCSVDYTPLGSYMTYDDQADPEAPMVSYNMTLQFQEINPVYDTDYTGHPIGY